MGWGGDTPATVESGHLCTCMCGGAYAVVTVESGHLCTSWLCGWGGGGDTPGTVESGHLCTCVCVCVEGGRVDMQYQLQWNQVIFVPLCGGGGMGWDGDTLGTVESGHLCTSVCGGWGGLEIH